VPERLEKIDEPLANGESLCIEQEPQRQVNDRLMLAVVGSKEN